MLSQYLKQCCLLIVPEESPAGSFSAVHTLTAGLTVEKRVLAINESTAEVWKSKSYQAEYQPATHDSALWIPAFERLFNEGWRKVILLRSAPEGLTQTHLEEAFMSLRILEITLGPLKNGGIYLLGLPLFRPELLTASSLESEPTWKTLQKSAGAEKAAMYKLPLL